MQQRSSHSDHALARRALWSARALFFANGSSMGVWSAFVPIVREDLDLSIAVLGASLFMMTGGAMAAMPLAGALSARFGSTPLRVISVLFSLSLLLPVLSPSLPLLLGAFLVFGALNGAMDVTMNAEALAVEERLGRPIMSSAHACFSLGGLAGATLAGALLTRFEPVTTIFAIVPLTFAGTLWGLRTLLPPEEGREQQDIPPVRLRPDRYIAVLGTLAFLALMSEGAMLDWSATLLRTEYDASTGFAAAGYAVFSGAMAAGRLTGDYLAARLSRPLLFQISATLGGTGLLLGLLPGSIVTVLIGLACLGLGLSNLIPILFSAAARGNARQAGPAVSIVATLGYTGFLLGPPLIGFIAEATDLKLGIGVVAVLTLSIALGGRALGGLGGAAPRAT